MAPNRGDYQAAIGGGRLLISPIVNNSGFGPGAFGTGSRAGSLRINVDNNTVTLPGMTAFVLSGFATEAVRIALNSAFLERPRQESNLRPSA